MRLLLVLLLVFFLIGMLPVWPYSAAWGVGYYPSGLFGLILLVVLFSALFSRGARVP
jgi:hypothetical protein